MTSSVWVLLLITNLGPSYSHEYEKIVTVHATYGGCRDRAASLADAEKLKPYMRLECRQEVLSD